MQDVHEAFVAAGDRLETADTGELAFVGPGVLEIVAINDLHRAPSAQGVAREPDFAVTAVADAAHEWVIGNARRGVTNVPQRLPGQSEPGFKIRSRGVLMQSFYDFGIAYRADAAEVFVRCRTKE